MEVGPLGEGDGFFEDPLGVKRLVELFVACAASCRFPDVDELPSSEVFECPGGHGLVVGWPAQEKGQVFGAFKQDFFAALLDLEVFLFELVGVFFWVSVKGLDCASGLFDEVGPVTVSCANFYEGAVLD